jgi:hypothetical protein
LTGAQGFSKLSAVDVRCISASGDNLDILGEALVKLKIHGFSWNWKLLVSRKLCGRPILGMDFISRNKLVLDFGEGKCYFGFAPAVKIPLVMPRRGVGCSQTTVRSGEHGPEFRCGTLNAQHRAK